MDEELIERVKEALRSERNKGDVSLLDRQARAAIAECEKERPTRQELLAAQKETARIIERLEIKCSDLTTANGDQAQTIERLERELAEQQAYGDERLKIENAILGEELTKCQAQAAAMRGALEVWEVREKDCGCETASCQGTCAPAKTRAALSPAAGKAVLRVVEAADAVLEALKKEYGEPTGIVKQLAEALAELEKESEK